ncbi:MAG: GC-type dockerin domain-anchored protein, partial [Planctomycetota bacterium]
PDPFPRDRAVPLDHGFVTYWMMGRNMPRDTLYRFRFFAPDGRLDFDSGQRLLNFTTDGPLHRYWAYFTWNVTDMKQEPGDWRVEIEFNNERIHDATVRVLADGQTPGNTPPVPPIIEFDPPNPGPEDVTFVRVRTDLVDDDAEYDLVRYRYRWQIDGLTIRDTVSAGGADAIPSLADLGLDSTPPRMISVEVTPNDGTIDGQTATLAVLVDDGGCLADVNDDGLATSADFFAWVSAFGTQAPECDVNNDNACTSADFFAWVSAFSQGC